MQSYEEIKTKLAQNKAKIVLGVCFVLVFIVGFGSGSYVREIRRDTYKASNNYTTQPAKKPTAEAAAGGQVLGQGTTSASATPASLSNCIIKGNISTNGKKIYHMQGGAFYKKVKPEQCFNTEGEALAAWFVKSGR